MENLDYYGRNDFEIKIRAIDCLTNYCKEGFRIKKDEDNPELNYLYMPDQKTPIVCPVCGGHLYVRNQKSKYGYIHHDIICKNQWDEINDCTWEGTEWFYDRHEVSKYLEKMISVKLKYNFNA